MKILVVSSIDPGALEALQRDHDVVCEFGATQERLCELLADREVLIFRSGVQISATVLQHAPRLRLLLRAGSGLDNVDVQFASDCGIRVVRVPGASAQPVAEFTFALLLSLVRNVARADGLLRDGHWPKSQLGGPLLAGKTLGIVGAGSIGSRVGSLGAAWGMRAIGCVAHPDRAARSALLAKGIVLKPFDAVVAEADFLCLHVPLDDSTWHMVDASVLQRMKEGSYLVNVARGGVVDEEALYAELTQHHRLRGAALDVHEHEGEGTLSRFRDLPSVVLTPHIGAMALDSQRLIGERLLELLEAYASGGLEHVLTEAETVEHQAAEEAAS